MLDAGFNDYKQIEQVKDLIKYRFLKTESVSDNGEVIERVKNTSELGTSEMMDLCSEIQTWAMEFLSVYIPDPNETLKLEI